MTLTDVNDAYICPITGGVFTGMFVSSPRAIRFPPSVLPGTFHKTYIRAHNAANSHTFQTRSRTRTVAAPAPSPTSCS